MTAEDGLLPYTSSPAKVFHRSFFAMNTRFSIVLPGIDPDKAEALAEDAQRELRRQERLMSRFDPASPVSELNHRAAGGPVAVSPDLWEVLTLCREYWERTGGAFDVTQWPVQCLWREHLEQGKEPDDPAIAEARQQTGMQKLSFDEASHTIHFQAEGMSLDLGGFGKGFALERLAQHLRAEHVERAFLSFGESSIAVLGAHPLGPAWRVGIADLFRPSNIVHTFHLQDASLSSSGTSPFNNIENSRALGHIVDPSTGRPIEGYRTMSVACSGGIEAEVLSTALLVTPASERAARLSGFSVLSAVEITYHQQGTEFVPRIEWQYER